MLGQERLVRRDHVLAALEDFEQDRAGRLQPADKMGHDADLLILRDPFEIGRENPHRQRHAARLLDILHDDLFEPQTPAGMARGPIGMIQEQPRHSAADRSEPDNADFGLVHETRALDRARRPCEARKG